MKTGKVINNTVMIELDEDNDYFITKNNVKLYIDNTFEPEKHCVVLGTVVSVPDFLLAKNLPWETNLEIKTGDRAVIYYLAVMNCLRKEISKSIKENGKRYIFIKYNNIYAVIRDGKVIPVNGYILAEPIKNPFLEKKKNDIMTRSAIELILNDDMSNTDVVFAKAVYVGTPNKKYVSGISDANINVNSGDNLILKKIRDIPVEYEYHSKIDNGRKLYRIQRHDILAIL